MELGDTVEKALGIMGVTPKAVSEWLGEPCGCEERKEKLNRISIWARRVCKGKLDKAKEYLETIIEERLWK